MNILFVVTFYPSKEFPQEGIFLEQHAKALKQYGHKVEVLFIKQGTDECQESFFNGINVIRIGTKRRKKLNLLLPGGVCREDAKKIYKAIKKGYDVVSVHSGGLDILRSVLAICRKCGTKVVVHFHGLNVWYEFFEKRKWMHNCIRLQKKQIYSKIDAMVGVSDKVTNRFSEKIKNVPAFTVYNGVNLDLFKFKDRDFSKDKKLKVLIVANLIELKGHDYLIKAIAKAKQKGIDAELTIAGRGPLEAELKDLAKKLNISDSVKFTGYIEYEKIADLMQENDVFIMPSYYEALGCVYLEAMSSGMITIGVWGQGIDEIIKDGENGFLVEPKSVDAIVSTLEKIHGKSSDELKSISRNANETALEYNWDKSGQMLSSVYHKMEEDNGQV